MKNYFAEFITDFKQLIPVLPIQQSNFSKWLDEQPERIKNLITINDFVAKPASFCFIPNQDGKLEQVLLGIKDPTDFWSFGVLPKNLNEGIYRITTNGFGVDELQRIAIAWGLGSYSFTKYKKDTRATKIAKLLIPPECNKTYIENILSAIFLVRDLINLPANDLNPPNLAKIASEIAEKFNANFKEIIGDDLILSNFPSVHLVGRASSNAPRLIDIKWGEEHHPKITLIGKGVCFDSGGLDLKTAQGMELMKKDMGGAAHALGLAQMIMAANLPIRLRVIIPIVENLVSGSSFKPGDILKTRKGTTVEIVNTDAEGRLILSDSLTYASEENPDLLLDFATLTGAARIALGTDIAAVFGNNKVIIDELQAATKKEGESMWEMPLYAPYKKLLESKIADIKNCSSSSYGGSITAALFLQEFIGEGINWVHFDIMASNVFEMPGRPEGGEAVCLRGLFNYLQAKYLN